MFPFSSDMQQLRMQRCGGLRAIQAAKCACLSIDGRLFLSLLFRARARQKKCSSQFYGGATFGMLNTYSTLRSMVLVFSIKFFRYQKKKAKRMSHVCNGHGQTRQKSHAKHATAVVCHLRETCPYLGFSRRGCGRRSRGRRRADSAAAKQIRQAETEPRTCRRSW